MKISESHFSNLSQSERSLLAALVTLARLAGRLAFFVRSTLLVGHALLVGSTLLGAAFASSKRGHCRRHPLMKRAARNWNKFTAGRRQIGNHIAGLKKAPSWRTHVHTARCVPLQVFLDVCERLATFTFGTILALAIDELTLGRAACSALETANGKTSLHFCHATSILHLLKKTCRLIRCHELQAQRLVF